MTSSELRVDSSRHEEVDDVDIDINAVDVDMEYQQMMDEKSGVHLLWVEIHHLRNEMNALKDRFEDERNCTPEKSSTLNVLTAFSTVSTMICVMLSLALILPLYSHHQDLVSIKQSMYSLSNAISQYEQYGVHHSFHSPSTDIYSGSCDDDDEQTGNSTVTERMIIPITDSIKTCPESADNFDEEWINGMNHREGFLMMDALNISSCSLTIERKLERIDTIENVEGVDSNSMPSSSVPDANATNDSSADSTISVPIASLTETVTDAPSNTTHSATTLVRSSVSMPSHWISIVMHYGCKLLGQILNLFCIYAVCGHGEHLFAFIGIVASNIVIKWFYFFPDPSNWTEWIITGFVIALSCLGRDPRRNEHTKILQIDLIILYWKVWCGDDNVLIAASCLWYLALIYRIINNVPKGREMDWSIMMLHLSVVVMIEVYVLFCSLF